MVPWIGFAYAALAALGHSGIDASRKLASQRLNPTELVALVGVLDALFLTVVVIGLDLTPGFSFLTWPLIKILFWSSIVKVLGVIMYQRALQVSPLSVTVPYLAFVPALILVTGFLMLRELPSLQGMAGVCIVTLGGYLLAVNASKGASGRDGALSPKAGAVDAKVAAMKSEVEQEMGFAADLLPGVGLPGTPKEAKQQLIKTASERPVAASPSFRTRQASFTTSGGSKGLGEEASFPWELNRIGARGRMGLGLGIGLGSTGASEAHVDVGEDATPASSLLLRGPKDDLRLVDLAKHDSKDRSYIEYLPMRVHFLEAAAFFRSSSSLMLERLRVLGVEEGTLLMLLCAVCFSLTNGFDKLGIHNSPSVLVFAWVQRLCMGLPPAVYLFVTSPASFSQLLRYFPILSAVSFFELLAIVCYLKSIEWLLVSYAVAAKRINILVSVLVGHFVFKENIWKRIPYILLMMLGMLLVIFSPT